MLKLTQLNNNQLNYLNIGLMLVSAFLALLLPFELFLFSYAILGPLHYLTEIGWLHQKNYFTKGKYDFLALVFLCVLIFIFTFIVVPKSQQTVPTIVALAILLSAIGVLVKDNFYRFVLVLLTLIGFYIAKTGNVFFVWIGVFLPTIIHVFLFTFAFMLYGVLKNKTRSGFLSIAVLLILSILLVTVKAPNLQYQVSNYVVKSYQIFSFLNFKLIEVFSALPKNLSITQTIYQTNIGFIVMRFIAFAYTYHYLNWFSKTSIIQWHKISKPALIITLLIWVTSIALYIIDYNIGIKALYFLSFLHVFLEFPLNITSFYGIIKAIIPNNN